MPSSFKFRVGDRVQVAPWTPHFGHMHGTVKEIDGFGRFLVHLDEVKWPVNCFTPRELEREEKDETQG